MGKSLWWSLLLLEGRAMGWAVAAAMGWKREEARVVAGLGSGGGAGTLGREYGVRAGGGGSVAGGRQK